MSAKRWVTGTAVAAVLAGGAAFGVRALLDHTTPPPPGCTVGSGPAALLLSPDQAADATAIAGVARRMDLPDHAVTVAVATALQESKLVNVPFGDRDSLGLFQQRPSQGWGRPSQLLTPAYAAAAFYERLVSVPGWQTLPVAEAAQAVQHSADGAGYAVWEEEARAIARALTGEIPAGLTCRFADDPQPQSAALRRLARHELGAGALTAAGASAAHDWTVAAWLVGHAHSYGVATVDVRGRRWTAESGHWSRSGDAGTAPTYDMTAVAP
jgi:hypothetical protein